MEKAGLIVEPEFDNPNYYLGEGTLTKQTELIRFIAKRIIGSTDEEKVRNMIAFLNSEVPIKKANDGRKFQKTAEEILNSRQRTGCSDSAILFCTMARAMGIPAMMVVTFDKDWRENIVKGKNVDETVGHFYSAVYLKEKDDNGVWKLIDTHKTRRIPKDIDIQFFDLEDRNIYYKGESTKYAFAYVRDIRDISLNGRTIDNASNMRYIQVRAALEANGRDILQDDIIR